jgi:hypothetical protein
MAIKRATKSLPLTGGMSNEVPDELLAFPGMVKIENARFTKKDYAEKVEPMPFAGAAGIANHIGQDPIAFEEAGGTAVAIGKTKYSRYDGTTFVARDHNTDPLGMEKILSSAAAPGATNFTWCHLSQFSGTDYETVNGYAVAFERRATPGISYLIFQRYDLQGNMLDEVNLGSNRYQPKLINGQSAHANLWYQFGGTLKRTRINGTQSTAAWTGTETTVASNLVWASRQEMDGAQAWGSFATERLRMGFAYNNQATGHFKLFMDEHASTGHGVVCWKDTSSGNIKWQNIASDGEETGSVYTLASTTDTGITSVHAILDVCADATYNYFLVTETDLTDSLGNVMAYARRTDKTNAASTACTLNNGAVFLGTSPMGTIGVNAAGSAWVNLNYVNGSPLLRMGTADSNSDGVYMYNVTSWSGTVTTSRIMVGYRSASNIIIDKDQNPTFCLEQWANFTPNDNTKSSKAIATTPAAIKPVTTCLCRIDVADSNQLKVIGAFDAGQSKLKDASQSEMSNSVGDLRYMNGLDKNNGGSAGTWYHTFRYCNRNIQTIEDMFIFLDDVTTPSPDNNAQGNEVVAMGSARGNLYEIGPEIPIKSVKHGDGFIMNTAVPTWFDGTGLTEMAILDQPEILGVIVDSGGGTTAIETYGYNELQDDYQTITCVAGYTDTSGQIHRSAPSFPVFVGNLNEKIDAIWKVNAYAIPPLAISGTNKEYFMEYYLGATGDSVPDLAARIFYTPNSSLNFCGVTFPTVMQPTNDGTLQWYNTPHQSQGLYTGGNVLPADPWPSFKHMTVTSRRMFAVAESAPSILYYSKVFQENVAPEFSAALTLALGGATELTGIGHIDDKVIAFERDAAHVIYGGGPDNTGANGSFIVEKMSTNKGCTDIESIIETVDGLAYYSSVTNEFHLITRDLQIVDIGKPVMDLTAGSSFDIRAAIVYPDAHEIRWYANGVGTTDLVPAASIPSGGKEQPPRARVGHTASGSYHYLSYNMEYAKWAVCNANEEAPIYKACIFNNKPAGLSTNGNVYVTNEDWTESSYMKWETPWIKVNQLQDYGRMYGATFYGRYLSDWSGASPEAGDLHVTCRYDYEENGDTDIHLFRANEHFGDSSGGRLQFEVPPGRPKCQSIKFEIEEVATQKIEVSEPNYARGRGIALLTVDILYGAKGSSSKLNAKRKV